MLHPKLLERIHIVQDLSNHSNIGQNRPVGRVNTIDSTGWCGWVGSFYFASVRQFHMISPRDSRTLHLKSKSALDKLFAVLGDEVFHAAVFWPGSSKFFKESLRATSTGEVENLFFAVAATRGIRFGAAPPPVSRAGVRHYAR
jgi:hypothetical protein